MVFQGIISYRSPVPNRIVEKLGLYYSKPDLIMRFLNKNVTSFSKKYLGITNHGFFVDDYFKGFNQISRLVFMIMMNHFMSRY